MQADIANGTLMTYHEEAIGSPELALGVESGVPLGYDAPSTS